MSARLRSEVLVATVAGQRVAYVLPVVPDDAPVAIREGLARRRIVVLGAPCPCGARPATLTRQRRRALERARAKGQAYHVAIVHEHDCPAGDDILGPLLREWAGVA